MTCPKRKQGPMFREIRPLRDVCRICGQSIWLDFAIVNKAQHGKGGRKDGVA